MSEIRRRTLQRIILQLEELIGHLEDILDEDALQDDLPEDAEDGVCWEMANDAWGKLFGAWGDLDGAAGSVEDIAE